MATDKIKARHLDEEFVLPVEKVDGAMKIYYGLSELNLDETTATYSDIVNAMDNGSVLLHGLGADTSIPLKPPFVHGLLEVVKYSPDYAEFSLSSIVHPMCSKAYYNASNPSSGNNDLGAWNGWDIPYSVNNKPTPVDVGAVSNLLFFSSGSIKDIAFDNQSFFAVVNDGVTDMPSNGNWWSVESNRRESFISLKATNLFDGTTYVQTYVNGAWLADWVKDYNSANKPTASDIGAFETGGIVDDARVGKNGQFGIFGDATNSPSVKASTILSQVFDENFQTLFAIDENGNAFIAKKSGVPGVWENWKQLFFTDGSVSMTGPLVTSSEIYTLSGYNQFSGSNEFTLIGAYQTPGSVTGRRWLGLWNETLQKEYAVKFGQSDGSAWNIFGEHNVDLMASALKTVTNVDITAGSAYTSSKSYLVYE